MLHLYWALGGTVGLTESAGRRLAEERPAEFVLGGLYGVALVLVVRAVVVAVLLVTDPGFGDGAITGAQRTWTLWIWNPWFLLGGVLFGAAALAARAARRPDR